MVDKLYDQLETTRRRCGGEEEEDHFVDNNCANLPRRQTRNWNQTVVVPDMVKWLPPLVDIVPNGSESTMIVNSIQHQLPQCPATCTQSQQPNNRLAVVRSWTPSPTLLTDMPRRPPRSLSSSLLKAESFSTTTDQCNAVEQLSSSSSLRTIREAPEECQRRDHAKVAEL
jgi:hypothetical protein